MVNHWTPDHFRESAENCAQLAERATEDAAYNRYKRMEAAWLALAKEQDWLDGAIPTRTSTNGDGRITPPL
jgi:hypothetical protein